MGLRLVASGCVDAGVSPAFTTNGNTGFRETITRSGAGRFQLTFDKPWGAADINVQVSLAETAAEGHITATRPTGDPTTIDVWTNAAGVATDLDFNVTAFSHF